MNPLKLLKEINVISKKYEILNQKTGGYFNIFNVANIVYDEVIICRELYEFLSPKGSHFQGTAYLKQFFNGVLKIDVEEKELETARVYREYVINNNRRIDLVIETNTHFIPIEVKINANDQPKQCYDYYQMARNSNVYYLTLEGNTPGDISAYGLSKTEAGYKEVTCISFADDILNWLDDCVKQIETIKIAPIREVILQFMSIIRKLTNQLEEDKEMEVKELLMESSENMRSAIAIENSLNEAKQDLILKLFKSIEKKVGIDKLKNQYDYESDDYKKIKEFYRFSSKSTLPGISYLYQSDVKKILIFG